MTDTPHPYLTAARAPRWLGQFDGIRYSCLITTDGKLNKRPIVIGTPPVGALDREDLVHHHYGTPEWDMLNARLMAATLLGDD